MSTSKSILCSSILMTALFLCENGIMFIIASTAAMAGGSEAASAVHPISGSKGATGLLGFPASAPLILSSPIGSVSYQPHDSEEFNERVVHDPSDAELLRALNAETIFSSSGGGDASPDSTSLANLVTHMESPDKYELLQMIEDDLREEQDVVRKSAILLRLLEDPTIDALPVIYVEEYPREEEDINSNVMYPLSTGAAGLAKRSRYYRKYPWKRQSRNRSNYEPEMRYACTPSKEDVFKLLVSLHENRKGNHHKTVNFCNRKRPAKAIFTNIRFLG